METRALLLEGVAMSGDCVSGNHEKCPDSAGEDTGACSCPCHPIWPDKTPEYRLVVIRPKEHAYGRKEFYYNKRDIEHARKGLLDHYDNEAHRMVVLAQDGKAYHVWHARIETRNVSEWETTT